MLFRSLLVLTLLLLSPFVHCPAVQAQLPTLTVTPTDTDLSATAGSSVTATFTVTGGFAPYTVTPQLGTVTEIENVPRSHVTYRYDYQIPLSKPACDQLVDQVTIKDSGGTTVPQQTAFYTVNISVEPGPLEATPSSLNPSGTAGQQVTATFSISGGNPIYTVSAAAGTVTPNTLSAPGTVTYEYQIPATASPGSISDTITIEDTECTSGQGNRTLTVPVTIQVTAPPLMVTPTSYSLTGAPGETVTGTPDLQISGGEGPYSFSTPGGGSVVPNPLPNPGSAQYRFTIPSSAQSGDVLSDTIMVSDNRQNQATVPVTITVIAPPPPPPTPSTTELNFVAAPGETVEGSFGVTDGSPPIAVAADKGAVTPDTLAGPGDIDYTYTVPSNTPAGSVINDKISLTDSLGRSSEIKVTIAVNPLTGIPGLTPPERAVGGAMETLCPQLEKLSRSRALTPGEQDLLDRCSEMIDDAGSNPSGVKAALGQVANEETAAAGTMITELTNTHLYNVSQRLASLRGGAKGVSIKGLSFNYDGQQVPISLFAEAVHEANKTGAAGGDEPDLLNRLGVFVSGAIDFGDKDKTDSESGFDFDTNGITAGIDYWFTKRVNLGAFVGYSNTGANFDSDGGNLDSDGWNFGLYGNYNVTDNFYVDAIFNYGWLSYDSTRKIIYTLETDINREAKADYDGDQYSFSLGAGYDFHRQAWTFGLFGRLNYIRANIDSYTEKGAEGLNLKVDDQTVESFTTALGGMVSYSISTNFGVLIPQLSFDWEHEYEDDGRLISSVFVNDPNRNAFEIPTDDPDRNYFHLSPGISAVLPGGFSAYVNYEVTLGHDDITENLVSGGIRYEF